LAKRLKNKDEKKVLAKKRIGRAKKQKTYENPYLREEAQKRGRGKGTEKCKREYKRYEENKQSQAIVSVRRLKRGPVMEKDHTFLPIWRFRDRKRERESEDCRKSLGKMNSRENARGE